MADVARPISFLPAIKCSTCGVETELAKMGDHVCSIKPAELPPKLTTSDERPATAPTSGPKPNQRLFKPGRAILPRIDSSVANRTFLPLDQLTPASNGSEPRSVSPASPCGSYRTQKPSLKRSQITPLVPLNGPPSPDLPSSFDCAFPPFPTGRSIETKPKSTNKVEEIQRQAQVDHKSAPQSPKTPGGASILKRMDSIAPGPFDARRGSRSRTREVSNTSSRTHSGDHSRSSSGSSKRHNQRSSNASSDQSRSSVQSNRSSGRTTQVVADVPRSRVGPPPRPFRPDTIDEFIEQLQSPMEQLASNDHSKSHQWRTESGNSLDKQVAFSQRRPSEPAMSVRPHVPAPTLQPSPMVPQPPSRSKPGGMPVRSQSSDADLPALGPNRYGMAVHAPFSNMTPTHPPRNVPRQATTGSFHVPMDSASSEGSTSSPDARTASSKSSPPIPEALDPSRGSSQTGSNEESLTVEKPAAIQPKPQHNIDMNPDLLRSLAFHGNTLAQTKLSNLKLDTSEPPQPPSNRFVAEGPESPMDPDVQGGLFRTRTFDSTTSSGSSLNAAHPPAAPRPEPRKDPITQPSESEPATTRRAPPPIKGNCRGCGQTIVGKSVKAADGRLTGRFHKQCFVCRTCKAPFQTADFYVINNHPYCGQHYHQLNGSLCKSCNRGIEGQCLETEQKQKFHPGCFTCHECRVPLSDDYFEVGRKVYCERHAFQSVQQNKFLGAGQRFPERRTTRLMMM